MESASSQSQMTRNFDSELPEYSENCPPNHVSLTGYSSQDEEASPRPPRYSLINTESSTTARDDSNLSSFFLEQFRNRVRRSADARDLKRKIRFNYIKSIAFNFLLLSSFSFLSYLSCNLLTSSGSIFSYFILNSIYYLGVMMSLFFIINGSMQSIFFLKNIRS